MPNRVGQQLGNYRLISLLGQGGFAEIYLGQHIHLETEAAIKVLQTQLENADMKAFRNEARLIARLKHPHIVSVLDFGVEGTTPYLVMEYAPGGSLRKLHPQGSRLPLDTVISYIRQIGSALQYAHEQKLIHRDIKPENLLVGRANEILLSDFGIALTTQSSHSQSLYDVVAGTLPYTAPEQLKGRPCAASDQYALGIVVYEWLCGRRPFYGDPMELIDQHALVPPPPLRQHVSIIWPTVEAIILKTLAKEPQKRFASVKDFAIALEQANTVLPAPTSPVISSYDPIGVMSPTSFTAQTVPTKILPTALLEPQEESHTHKGEPAKHSLPRRTIVVGLAGLIAAGGTGSLLWLTHPISPTVGTTIYTYRGHSDTVFRVAWSPDGTRIASASRDKTAQVWEAATGKRLLTYRGHTDDSVEATDGSVEAAVWSSDNTRIASGSHDKTVQVWEAATGKRLLTYRGHKGALYTVAWSPDGNHIASGDQFGTVQVWSAAQGNLFFAYEHNDAVNMVAWSSDSKYLASASGDKTVQTWDAATGSHISTYQGHKDSVNTVAWSPDGKRIASGSRDTTVRVWETATRKDILIYRRHTQGVISAVWSPNGRYLASGGADNLVRVWDATTGKDNFFCTGHLAPVWCVAWSPSGERITSSSADSTVKVWEASS